ncbi:MAG: hypothetical protein LC721_12945, partial [Actinobacteria bacterium]|nr:hypothetical protein [Actinomycetota bacterium]
NTDDHPYPEGFNAAHFEFTAIPGQKYSLFGRIDWLPRQVGYHDYGFFETWAHNTGIRINCTA